MTNMTHKAEGGFSFVEPLIAMVVLSISLLGAAAMFLMTQDGISGGAKSLEAMSLAESKAERLMTQSFLTLLDGAVAGDGEYTAREIVNGFVVTWTIRPDNSTLASSRAADITVTAAWLNRIGYPHKATVGLRRANPVYIGEAS